MTFAFSFIQQARGRSGWILVNSLLDDGLRIAVLLTTYAYRGIMPQLLACLRELNPARGSRQLKFGRGNFLLDDCFASYSCRPRGRLSTGGW